MIDTDEIRRNLEAGNGEGAAISVAHVLCAEVDRLRALIESSRNTCSRAGGCIPRD